MDYITITIENAEKFGLFIKLWDCKAAENTPKDASDYVGKEKKVFQVIKDANGSSSIRWLSQADGFEDNSKPEFSVTHNGTYQVNAGATVSHAAEPLLKEPIGRR